MGWFGYEVGLVVCGVELKVEVILLLMVFLVEGGVGGGNGR